MPRLEKMTNLAPDAPKRRAPPIVVFLGAIAAGLLCGSLALHVVPGRSGGTEALSGRIPETPPPAVPPSFKDVTAAAGIRYRHEAGNRGKFYYPEVMGAGCAFFDYDGDGRLDVYFVNGNLLPPEKPDPKITNVLYRNKGDGTFEDVTEKAGVGDPSYGQGCCAADYDGDRDQDLYVTNYGANVFYRNKGDGTFEKLNGVAASSGWGQSCAFFDADGDSCLDLYAQNYLIYSIEGHEDWPITIAGKKVLDYCSPSGYDGEQDRLFINRRDGTFRDVTAESGIVVPGGKGTGMGLICADMDDDGDMDIAVSNDTRPNFYFRNEGKGRFTECGLSVGLAYNAEGGTEAFMGIDAGDYDGDGLLDLAIPCLRTEGFNLFRNLGGAFSEVSVTTGLDAATSAYTGFAPVFIDHDSDGDLDLFFTCGEVRMGRTEESRAGASFLERYAMQSLLLENRDGRFVDVSNVAGTFFQEKRVSRSCSAGDYDDDGDLDLVVTSMGGEAVLLRNDTRGGHWIGFKLEGKPPNTDAIGARLRLRAAGRAQVRQVYGGGSYLGQRDRRQLYGLGAATAIEDLWVRWPDGSEATYQGLEIGRYHTLRQEGDK